MLKAVNKFLDSRFARNGYLVFSPFLIFYCIYIKRHRWPVLFGDEPRYVTFANNLLHGFFSTPAPHINLWSGPGYPILLIPFVYLHLSIVYLAMLNGALYYLSVVFLYKALCCFISRKAALFAAFLWAIYPNMIGMLSWIYTETFTAFIVCAFIYSISLFYVKKNNKYLVTSGILLGLLALVKISFGYIILLVLLVCLVLLFIKKAKFYYVKSVNIMQIAFLVTLPYLFYTYNITGKIFYWGNSGGMSLYWMTTSYDQEYGDWKNIDLHNSQYPVQYISMEGDSILQANHKKDIAFILQHNELQQDSIFKKMAINNIRQRPKKFIINCFYNVSRMLFNFPFSFTYQDAGSISNIVTGSLIFWASIIAAILSVINWRMMKFPVKFTLLITLIYFLLASTLSAYPRMFDVMVPVFIFWIAIVVANTLKLKLLFAEKETASHQ